MARILAAINIKSGSQNEGNGRLVYAMPEERRAHATCAHGGPDRRIKKRGGPPGIGPTAPPFPRRALRRVHLVAPEGHAAGGIARIDHQLRVAHELLVVDA